MEIFASAEGYKTRHIAVTKLRLLLSQVLGEEERYVRWFVVALPNGRYLGVVILSSTEHSWAVSALAGKVGVL